MAADANHGATVQHLAAGLQSGNIGSIFGGGDNPFTKPIFTTWAQNWVKRKKEEREKAAAAVQQDFMNKQMMALNEGIYGKTDPKTGKKTQHGMIDHLEGLHGNIKSLNEGINGGKDKDGKFVPGMKTNLEAMYGNMNDMKASHSQATASLGEKIDGLANAVRDLSKKMKPPSASGASPT